jgi:hypothetical protein
MQAKWVAVVLEFYRKKAKGHRLVSTGDQASLQDEPNDTEGGRPSVQKDKNNLVMITARPNVHHTLK